MNHAPIVTAGTKRTALLVLLVAVLVAAAVNVPFAMTRLIPPRKGMPGTALRLKGAETPARWPSSTPHEAPWPAPGSWTEWRTVGVRWYDVRTQPADPASGKNGWSMTVKQYGWPFPVLEEKQMWWDWSDSALQGPESSPPMHLLPVGLFLNPLLVGLVLFAIAAGPWLLIGTLRRARRRTGGRCLECGYALRGGTEAGCPECGWNRTG